MRQLFFWLSEKKNAIIARVIFMQFLGTAAMIAVLSLLSKFLGLAREMLTAFRFGTGPAMDSYVAARTATIILMGTIGAALNSSMMPVLSEIELKHGRKNKYIFFNRMVNLVLFLSVFICLISMAAAPLLVKVIAWNFDSYRHDTAVLLTRIGMPIVIFLGLNYLYTAFLQQSKIFFPSAASGIPYNFCFFIYLWFCGTSPDIKGLMLITVLAAFFQFAILIPSARKLKYRFHPRRRVIDKDVVKVSGMVIPVLIGSSVQQINTMIDRTLASGLEKGSISSLSYASRVNDVVISVFVAAITTVIFPMLSEAFAKSEKRRMLEILKKGIGIIVLVTIPASFGLATLSSPFIKFVFERGMFDANSTAMTAGALLMYSLGLTGIGVRLLLNKAFYSLEDTITPMRNGVATVFVNIISSVILVRFIKMDGIALGTSIAATFSTLSLIFLLRKKFGRLRMRGLLADVIKITFASAVMALAVYFCYYRLGMSSPEKYHTLFLGLSILIAVIVYFLLLLMLRVNALKELINTVFRRN